MTDACIHCGLCTKHCDFLQKYSLDLAAFAAHPDLAYHCFLCGDCSRVCPGNIDGRAVSLAMRQQHTAVKGLSGTGGHMLAAEKKNYLFRNYRRSHGKTALFPGCNFLSFFPETTDALVRLLAPQGIGVIYDCCGKPIGDLGLRDAERKNRDALRQRLRQAGVERLIALCPNCYHSLRTCPDIAVVSIYEFLTELGMDHVITEEPVPLFLPCPDRETGKLLSEIRRFLPNAAPIEGVQCCGLGGCAAGKEPELAAAFSKKISARAFPVVYTYCASCTGQLRRGGVEGATHILTELLATHEKPALSGAASLWNRARRVF